MSILIKLSITFILISIMGLLLAVIQVIDLSVMGYSITRMAILIGFTGAILGVWKSKKNNDDDNNNQPLQK